MAPSSSVSDESSCLSGYCNYIGGADAGEGAEGGFGAEGGGGVGEGARVTGGAVMGDGEGTVRGNLEF